MANNLDPRRRRGWQTMAKSFAGTRRRRVGQMKDTDRQPR